MTIKNILLVLIVFVICYGVNDSMAKESTSDSALQKKFGDYSAMGRLDDLKSMLSSEPSLVHSRINGENNERPLHWACLNGDPEVVNFLIRNGAEVNAKNISNHTPLDRAIFDNHSDMVKYLRSIGAKRGN